ncbi:hypothetical protein AB5N19_06569 [Seiridium cardinale]
MKFSAIVTLALSAVASAELTKVVRRQVSTQDAAMTDTNGNIVPFSTSGVNMASTKAGL